VIRLALNRVFVESSNLVMSSKSIIHLTAILAFASSTIVCDTSESSNHSLTSQTTASPQPSVGRQIPSSTPPVSPISKTNSQIRLIDFNKVTYVNFPDYSRSKPKHITLKAGEGKPSYVNYGDITGDKMEEAIVVLSVDNRGSAIQYYVYVFTEEDQKLKLLWDFEAGDRADGGRIIVLVVSCVDLQLGKFISKMAL
jgi:hypothetical protein